MGYTLFLIKLQKVTQVCSYVEISLRMDRVGAIWFVDQVASPCKLPGICKTHRNPISKETSVKLSRVDRSEA